MILIEDAHVLTMAGVQLDPGSVLIGDDGKILMVGRQIDCAGARRIDAKGLWLCPGFIDAHCHIGLFNDGMGQEGEDGNEMTDPVTPQMRAIDSINTLDPTFEEARRAGVTALCTGPGSGNVIGGQFVLLKNNGKVRVEDMIMRQPFAVKCAFGENPKGVYGDKKETPSTRMGTAAVLRQALIDAQEYQRKMDRANEDPDEDIPERCLKNEALCAVLRGEMPLKCHAHRADDILTAMRIAKEFGVDYTLDHCTEGHLILDVLKEENAKVILGPLLSDRSKVELNQMTYRAPALFYQAGIPFAMMTDSPVIPEQYLAVTAALAVREGLPEQEALASITIHAAQVLGVADRIGSIEPGKDADLVLFDGHPLDFRSVAERVWIDGKEVYARQA
jgi:imidazolonepropionase-like amidohydrolase